MLTTLRIIAALAWMVPLVLLTPAAWRAIHGGRDVRNILDWGVSLVFVLFVGRWLVLPDDQTFFALLYVLCSVLAGCLGVVAWHDRSA